MSRIKERFKLWFDIKILKKNIILNSFCRAESVGLAIYYFSKNNVIPMTATVLIDHDINTPLTQYRVSWYAITEEEIDTEYLEDCFGGIKIMTFKQLLENTSLNI